MARTEPAILRLLSEVEELVDDITANARADGYIDASERHIIERAREVGFTLELANLARLAEQDTGNTWSFELNPGLQRRIRETKADQARIRARMHRELHDGYGDHDPDDGAPQLNAA